MYAPLLDVRGVLTVEHAALDLRIHEALVVVAATSFGTIAIHAPKASVDRLAWRIESWIDGLKRTSRRGTIRYTKYGLTIWLVDSEKSPLEEPDLTLVVDSHLLPSCPTLATRAIVAGRIADRGHWFYDLCRKEQSAGVFSASAICSAYPDQVAAILPSDDPLYNRHMELKDEEIGPIVFRKFARQRLKVRTDKAREYLTQSQQAEAEKQLGKLWHTGRVGTPVVTFELSAVQKRYLAVKRLARINGKKGVILLKARRCGFTTLEQGQSYADCVTYPGTSCVTLANSVKNIKRIFRMVKEFHAQDPRKLKTDSDSKVQLELDNKSTFFIGTASATGFARGDMLRRGHVSEAAYCCEGPNQVRDLFSLEAALLGAAKFGFLVWESTANGRNWFHNLYKENRDTNGIYQSVFLPWFMDPTNVAPEGTYSVQEILETLTQEEVDLIERHGLTVPQIAFRRTIWREFKHLTPQEYPEDDERCFLSSGYCYFPVNDLFLIRDLLEHSNKTPDITDLPDGQYVEWEAPVPGERYVLGCDTSEGLLGGDPNGIGVMHKSSGRQVASAHGHFETRALGKLCVWLSRKYNKGLLGIERNGLGIAVLDEVGRLGYGKSHHKGGSLYHFKEGRPGWDTNGTTRPRIIDGVRDKILEAPETIVDPMFVSECLSFKKQPSGKYAADPGSHDDSVMKWGICEQMRHERIRKSRLRILEGTL